MRQWAQAGGGWVGLELALCFLQLGEGSSMVKHAENHVRKEWVAIHLLACMHARMHWNLSDNNKKIEEWECVFYFFSGFSGHAWQTCGHAECRHRTWSAAVASFFIVLQFTFLVWIWSCGIHSMSCIWMTVSMSTGCRGLWNWEAAQGLTSLRTVMKTNGRCMQLGPCFLLLLIGSGVSLAAAAVPCSFGRRSWGSHYIL